MNTCNAGHCENKATVDLGKYGRVVGIPGEVRFLCAEHSRGRITTKKRNRKVCSKCGGPLVEGRYCEKCD